MNLLRYQFGIIVLLLTCAAASLSDAQEVKKVPADHAEKAKAGLKLFKDEVRTVLVERCLKCHGGDSVKADFDLSTRKKLMESGYVEKTAKESYIMSLIRHEEEPVMPLKEKKLPQKQIDAIAKWIDLGAPYDSPLSKQGEKSAGPMKVTEKDREFWSFQPLKRAPVPRVNNEWCRTPIDRFIVRKLNEYKLSPNSETDRRRWLRRVYFGLIGLPPTVEEVDEFLEDKSPNAYERVVERLLDSPHYGERWARHWMDIARFAESHGYEQDYNRNFAFHYRDFLIQAFNANMPYDQFIRWQIAGDEIAPENRLALMATGFLGGGAFPTQLTEAEFESARYDELDDMTSTTSSAILGLSVGCARCHDHKFDPIPTRDYYRLASTFTTTIRSEIEIDLAPEENARRREAHQKEVTNLQNQLAQLKNDNATAETIKKLEAELDKKKKSGPNLIVQKTQVTSEGFKPTKHHADGRGFPHFYKQTYLLSRGDPSQKQGVAEQGFLQVLLPAKGESSLWKTNPPDDWTRTSYRRTALANWLTDADKGAGHLAARVIVNRMWHHHFGRGLVATPNDFGFQGDRPTHPELLDWLATELIRNDWRLKPIHKLIVTSAVYRQSSDFDSENAKIDRENKYHWRWMPKRLEAEPIRDSLLSVSGRLNDSMYGTGTLNPNMTRRSVYFFIKRSQLIPMMMLFDWPEHLVSIGRRSNTTIAPQALAFMNSPQGRSFANSLASSAFGETAAENITSAYRKVLGRKPSQEEQATALKFLELQQQRYQESGQNNGEQLAMTDLCQALLSLNEFIYLD